MNYEHIIFDLDHTLWDFKKCCFETLEEMYFHYELHAYGEFEIKDFQWTYMKHNNRLWAEYDMGAISKEELRTTRFRLTLDELGAKGFEHTHKLEDHFVEVCPTKSYLMPYAKEILDYLKDKYHLHILTNGFDEIQEIKLKSGDIHHYFKHIITAENTGFKKPQSEIYVHTLEKLDTEKHHCMIIGDSLITDIPGAKKAEIDHVYYNHENIGHSHDVMHEIKHLKELETIL